MNFEKPRPPVDIRAVLRLIAALALLVALGAATFALAGGNEGPRKQGWEGHGPPSWAPAYGWRCKEAGNRPGSDAFKDCIKSKKH